MRFFLAFFSERGRWALFIHIFIQVISYEAAAQTVFGPVHESHRLVLTDYGYRGPVSIMAVGDVMMGGSALSMIRQNGPDYPFLKTRAWLKKADYAIGNLEAPFTDYGEPASKTYTFRVPPLMAKGLVSAGFDVVTLANNHILDYGEAGMRSTWAILDSLGIAWCGAGEDRYSAGRSVILEHMGWKVAFLAFSLTYPGEFWATSNRAGTAYPHMEIMREELSRCRSLADLIIVSFHWGQELRATPKSYQRLYAHRAVEWGADLVLGHHPHVLQGLEIYKGRLIAYSLGNYVFGSYSRNSRDSVLLKVVFDSQGAIFAEAIPINVYNYQVHFQPRPLERSSRKKVLDHLNTISMPLNGNRRLIGENGLILFQPVPDRRTGGLDAVPPS
jgi:poly-gamma-glutamate synthesis protein (capsule biosynthesis protein)